MNARIASSAAAVAFALLGSSAAFAQQAVGEGYSAAPAFVSAESRADVKAELARARAAGEVNNVAESYGYTLPGRTEAVVLGKSRADVKADVRAAVRSGQNLSGGELG